MRPIRKRPRILKAESHKDLIVHAVFNNGETRLIDFKKIFDQLGIGKNSPAAKLRKSEIFKKFSIENGTLSWKSVEQEVPWGSAVRKVPFEIGADILYHNSQPTQAAHGLKIGELIRKERLAAKLTQDDLAKRSGTTAGYISRLENSKSDIELDTLQKLVEHGLRKKLLVSFG